METSCVNQIRSVGDKTIRELHVPELQIESFQRERETEIDIVEPHIPESKIENNDNNCIVTNYTNQVHNTDASIPASKHTSMAVVYNYTVIPQPPLSRFQRNRKAQDKLHLQINVYIASVNNH